VIATCNNTGSIFEEDPKSRLLSKPVSHHGRSDISAIETITHCSIDCISRPKFCDRLVGTVPHEHTRFWPHAEGALVLTSSIRVYAPLERHPLHAVQNGLHLDLDPLDIRQNSRTRRLEETRLRRNGNKISIGCRKKFRLQGHALNDIYEHTFVSMPNTGVLDKAPRNATNFVPGAPFSLTSFSYPWRVASYTGHRGKQVPIRPPNADVSGPWKKHRTRRSTGCWRACYLLWR